MKATTALCVAIAAAAFAGPANAIFKCTTAKGVIYQDRPCQTGTETDLQIVVPTGEAAPRASAPADESATAGNPRPEDKANAPRAPRHFGDASPTAAKPADRRAGEPSGSTADSPRRKEASASAESTSPLTPEQARKTDPSAKYYATEGFGTGSDTPSQMNCESPTGEKRVFYLSNGKLTSI